MVWLMSLVLAGNVEAGAAAATSSVHARPVVAAAAALLASERSRIRSNDRRMRRLMAEGTRRSRTFADLVSRVHATDLIVYVETVPQLPPDTTGRILLQGVSGGQRYLRVQVRSMLHGDQVIAVLAHELRHALEVAAHASVVDDATLAELYRRIGHVSGGTRAYETDDAHETGIRVRDELIG